MSYALWITEYAGEPNHVALFLETELSGDGLLFHVKGSLSKGMVFESKTIEDPLFSPRYVPGSKIYIGTIREDDLPRLETICRVIRPPYQALADETDTPPAQSLRRCGDWVQEVIDELHHQRLLQSPNAKVAALVPPESSSRWSRRPLQCSETMAHTGTCTL